MVCLPSSLPPLPQTANALRLWKLNQTRPRADPNVSDGPRWGQCVSRCLEAGPVCSMLGPRWGQCVPRCLEAGPVCSTLPGGGASSAARHGLSAAELSRRRGEARQDPPYSASHWLLLEVMTRPTRLSLASMQSHDSMTVTIPGWLKKITSHIYHHIYWNYWLKKKVKAGYVTQANKRKERRIKTHMKGHLERKKERPKSHQRDASMTLMKCE